MKTEQIRFFTQDGLPLNIVTTRMVTDVPPHPHDYIEVVFFQRGTALHTLKQSDGQINTHIVRAGDCFAILPGEYHAFSNGNSAFYYNLIIGSELLQRESAPLRSLAAWQPFFEHTPSELFLVHLNSREINYLEESLKRLQRELNLRQTDFHACAKIMLLNILLTIIRKDIQRSSKELPFTAEEQVLAVITAMEAHPENKYTLEKLARMANICISRFNRSMRSITGCSPVEYLTNLRLQKAAGMLFETRCSLKEIAEECGFCDDNYLVKRFRARYGVTPGEFRQRR